MGYVPAPDFPTGGIIIGRAGCNAAYKTGRGAVVLRAKSHIEEVEKGREAIVVTEMPYQVNGSKLQERIAECVRDKLVEGISAMRDESDRDGVRLVIELKRDADPDIVLNQLFRHTALQTSFGVSEQARAILDLRLQRLTGLERDKIGGELQELVTEIGGHVAILRSRVRLIEVLREELLKIREQFATPRRTAIEDVEFEADIEALIQREDMVVTVSHTGYIKRVPLSTYRSQRRGGRGRAGMAIRDEDFLSQVFVASTLAPVLFFTSSGRVYKLKVYRLPLGTPQARGRPMVNLLPNPVDGETISTVMPLPEDEGSWAEFTVMFATSKGNVRRNALSDFGDVRANGKIAMKFEDEDADDRLIAVATCTDANDVLLATRNGKAIRFPIEDVRIFTGRSSVGVRGIRLLGKDRVISMSILRHEEIAPEERNAYLSLAAKRRREMGEESE